MKGITELDVSGRLNQEIHEYESELTSLRGIEYFESLTILLCYGNQLTSLDVNQNTALKFLDCRDNQLTTLNVCNNTALTTLVCSINQLTTLDVNNNTALTRLDCRGNQLTELDASTNTALTELICNRNPGDGTVFPVLAWFDNNAVPSDFTTGSWEYYVGEFITIDYRKAE